MKKSISITIVSALCVMISTQAFSQKKSKVNYAEFQNLTEEVQKHRASRLVNIDTFNEYSKQENTIILDTRSKKAYDAIHIKGAVHLNFSDFTKKALSDIIPSKTTRILIYCNNNFISKNEYLMLKSRPLALNIPTFINLYGYGYENIYELNSYLDENDKRVNFVTRKGRFDKQL